MSAKVPTISTKAPTMRAPSAHHERQGAVHVRAMRAPCARHGRAMSAKAPTMNAKALTMSTKAPTMRTKAPNMRAEASTMLSAPSTSSSLAFANFPLSVYIPSGFRKFC